jgi:hypothetical protein
VSYDAMLEARYQREVAEDEAFRDWCEDEGVEPTDTNHTIFVDVIEAQREEYEVESYLHNQELRELEGSYEP